MGYVVAVSNDKGGAGKTSVAVNLAGALGEAGARVLLVDADERGDATTLLGFDGNATTIGTLADVIVGKVPAAMAVVTTAMKNVWAIVSSPELAGVGAVLATRSGQEQYLARALAPILDQYDVILVDSPPNLELMARNALGAADACLIPVKMTSKLTHKGASDLADAVADFNESGYRVQVVGILRIEPPSVRKAAKRLTTELGDWGVPVFRTKIPQVAVVEDAEALSLPVMLHAPDSNAARAFRQAADELLGLLYPPEDEAEAEAAPVAVPEAEEAEALTEALVEAVEAESDPEPDREPEPEPTSMNPVAPEESRYVVN